MVVYIITFFYLKGLLRPDWHPHISARAEIDGIEIEIEWCSENIEIVTLEIRQEAEAHTHVPSW